MQGKSWGHSEEKNPLPRKPIEAVVRNGARIPAKLNNLSFIPGIHMVEEKKVAPMFSCDLDMCAPKYMHINK